MQLDVCGIAGLASVLDSITVYPRMLSEKDSTGYPDFYQDGNDSCKATLSAIWGRQELGSGHCFESGRSGSPSSNS